MDRCLAELGPQRGNLRRTGPELHRMHDEDTDPLARKVARQLGSAVDAIAPPGTARRRALALAARGLKALPGLSSRRYVVHKIKTTSIRARGTLFLILRPYHIMSGRLVRALRPRQRSLSGSPVFPIHDRVDVSIIVPVSNHWSHTLACLESIIGTRVSAAAWACVVGWIDRVRIGNQLPPGTLGDAVEGRGAWPSHCRGRKPLCLINRDPGMPRPA